MTGHVQWYEPKKGYGFIKSDTSSLYFNKSEFINMNETKKGDLLNFEIIPGEKGPQAIHIYK